MFCLKTPLMPIPASASVKDVSQRSFTGREEKWLFLSDRKLGEVRYLVGLHCLVDPLWCQAVLEVASHLVGLQMVSPLERHLDLALQMPHLQSLSLTLARCSGHPSGCIGVSGEQLQRVSQKQSLLHLEVHCTLEAPVPLLNFPATHRLRWLRCGLHPLATALALVRAHADTLEELQLVAASSEPYGCPDLARELRQCGLTRLRRMVLLRQTAFGAACRHDAASCQLQRQQLRGVFLDTGMRVRTCVKCSVC